MDEERNRFDVYETLFYWWESKILLLSASIIGINKLDDSILKDSRIAISLKSYLYDLNLLLDKLESKIPEKSSKITDEIQLSRNKISILKLAVSFSK
ncbi:MAG: hypothetical protein IPL16_10465 [Ignavibacteria bacterium]|nr:hypothetical protein [Ignavibacteria bacterium]